MARRGDGKGRKGGELLAAYAILSGSETGHQPALTPDHRSLDWKRTMADENPTTNLVRVADELVIEEWRPVVGYEGRYEVSDLGRVRSLDSITPDRNGMMRRHRGRILSIAVGNRYPHINIRKDATTDETLKIHRMVLDAFVGPRPLGQECRHLDGNSQNCRLSNLAWGTHSENIEDCFAHGCYAMGERNPAAKLSDAAAQEIVRLRKTTSLSGAALGKLFGLHKSTVLRICAGERRNGPRCRNRPK